MTKAEKKMVNIAKNTLIGTLGGSVLGTLAIVPQICMALTAPVTYPIVGAVSGAIHKEFGTRTASAAAGAAIGACIVPFAPVALLSTPLNPLTYGFIGGAVGAVAGVIQNDQMDKEEK